MIRYRPGRACGSEWEPGRWEINAGVATATGSILTIAAALVIGFTFPHVVIVSLCTLAGAVATFIGLLFSVVACDEWIPLTGHRADYRAKKRAEQEAYIRWLERQARL